MPSKPLVQNGRVLMAAGKALSDRDIDLLQRRFPGTHLRVADPILDEAFEFEDDDRELQIHDTVREKIGGAMTQVQERFSERSALQHVDFRSVKRAVDEVLDYLRSNPASAALLFKSLESGSYLATHTGNVFYLSMLLATAARDYIMQERLRQTQMRGASPRQMADLTPLGLAAMFMDVGMLPLEHLYKKDEPLTSEEREQIRLHPLRGAEMLPHDFSAIAKAVVKMHHENYDGSGYPTGVKRDRLSVFARIVRIADAFDAATTTSVFREGKSAARVLWEMTDGPYKRFYDPVLMHIFGSLIQPFPIGAKLRLMDGRFAVVVKYNRKSPFHPYVLIAFDANGERLPDERLVGPFRLSDRPTVRVRMWRDEDLSYVYNSGLVSREIISPTDFRTMFQSTYP